MLKSLLLASVVAANANPVMNLTNSYEEWRERLIPMAAAINEGHRLDPNNIPVTVGIFEGFKQEVPVNTTFERMFFLASYALAAKKNQIALDPNYLGEMVGISGEAFDRATDYVEAMVGHDVENFRSARRYVESFFDLLMLERSKLNIVAWRLDKVKEISLEKASKAVYRPRELNAYNVARAAILDAADAVNLPRSERATLNKFMGTAMPEIEVEIPTNTTNTTNTKNTTNTTNTTNVPVNDEL